MLVLDGKTFAGDQLVVTLGVTTTGEKRILWLVQTANENKRVVAAFLRELVDRGFPTGRPLLAVLDGAKGRRAGGPPCGTCSATSRCSAASGTRARTS